MNWTEEQRRTIETTGRSILVSAAAGSGKTTVLVERIKNLLINEGADIDRFLITTFTNAAAAEMKERLDKALRDEMTKEGADKTRLAQQLSRLPQASIGTFHSFAFDVIRKYFYLIDMEPGFTVADDVQIGIIKRNAIDNVFARRYEENTEEFRNFVLKYGGGRSDSKIRDNVLETCRTLASIHHGLEWARDKASNLEGDDPVGQIGGYSFFAGRIVEGLEAARKHYSKSAELAHDGGLGLCYDAAAADVEQLDEMISRASASFDCSGEELRTAIEEFESVLASFKAGRMNYTKDNADEAIKDLISKARKAGKDQLDELNKEVYRRSFDDLNEELRQVHDDTVYYIDLIDEYYGELRTLKAKDNVIEFDDALHYCIDILDNEEAASELRDRYEYIFVDEYQDSNYLQEEIVGRIAREDNLFMVGDIKQCIYKFRLAEPEIFRNRASAFRDEAATGLLLNISSNFRSKLNVTEAVNNVFRQIMPGYDEAAELHCTAGDEHKGMPPRIHLIVNGEFDENAPEKNDAEGAVIAGIIKERLGTEIYDTKRGCARPLGLGDFAVIVRNNKEVEDFERYLINEGIAAYGESGGKYFETVEVQVFLNLLRIIDNMRQDIPLISAMRSVVFAFTTEELVRIRLEHREGSFSESVLWYAAEGSDEDLRNKISEMINRVDLWKEISRTVPLEDLMKEILYGTGYYDYCSGLPVGNQRISNLRLIAEKASKFEKMSHSGLYGFLRYIESMESADKTDSEAKIISEGEDVVRVMSVHKSKGLEFPVVIFANASKKTQKTDRSGQIKIHRDHGIGLPVVNRQEHWHRSSLLQKMILRSAKEEMTEEEIRILYVALTRAKDAIEIVATVKNTEGLDEEASTRTFLDMMYQPLTSMSGTEVIIYDDPDELTQTHRSMTHTPEQLYDQVRHFEDDALEALAAQRLSFEYPYSSSDQIKPKYSVTELAGAVKHEEPAEQPQISIRPFDPEAAGASEEFDAARKGTLMHLLMEKTDFAKATEGNTEDFIRREADLMLAEGMITAEEYDSLSIEKAAAFFEADIGMRAAEAAGKGRLRKEKEFIYSMEMSEDASSIVQGVIDCFFEEDDGYVIIDYKNSYVGGGRTEEDIAERYRGQVDLYRMALEGSTGKKVKEAYLFLFDTGHFIRM